ncbi:hypothetical protein DRJ48_04420 [Candidatus Woesearchaeota archaeon]|nr:MAG: hypothetical protein DRJ48_04420 [Candidatus Woesearchaeota archaeon]
MNNKLLSFIHNHFVLKKHGNFELAAGTFLACHLTGKIASGTAFAATHGLLSGPSLTLLGIGAPVLIAMGVYKKIKSHKF